jgi:hypothetical protein
VAHDSYLRPTTPAAAITAGPVSDVITVTRASGSATRSGQAQNAQIKQVRITIRSQRTAAQIG